MRFLPAGPRALLVELDDATGVRALAAEVERRRGEGWAPELRDVVPGACTLLLDGLDDVVAAAHHLRDLAVPRRSLEAEPAPAPVEIDCVYDGPDLAEVAAAWGVTVPEVIAVHRETEFRVDFCGFAPGFGYLSGLGPDRAVARRASPRARIPAGSVGLAGRYTGIYPRASPGGWQLIGRTETELWDVDRDPPALLAPGARVRFRDADAGGR